MNKRFTLIGGWMVLIVLSVWPVWLRLSWPAALGLMTIWYFLCWINIINEWDRRPIFLFGRYVKTLGPGLCLMEPLVYTALDDVEVWDTTIEVPVPAVQTKDNVNIAMVGVLTYRIDAEKVKLAVVAVEDVYDSLLQRALSTLVDQAGKVDLDHLLSGRDEFSAVVVASLKQRVTVWGVMVQAFEIKELEIGDEEVAQAIAMKARAEKEGAAELVRAGYQRRVAEELNAAASTYDEQGRWLKGMEVLVELSRSAQNSTILIPNDLTGALSGLVSAAKLPGAASSK